MIYSRSVDNEAYIWVEKVSSKHWTRSCQSRNVKYDMLLSNLYESFNATIICVRDNLILTMLKKIIMYITNRMYIKR